MPVSLLPVRLKVKAEQAPCPAVEQECNPRSPATPPSPEARLDDEPSKPPPPPSPTRPVSDGDVMVNVTGTDDVIYVPEAPVSTAPPSAEQLARTHTLKELREQAAQLGLATHGKKIELAERLLVTASGAA